MKIAPFIAITFLISVITHSTVSYVAHKKYEQNISAPWELALRSSTLSEKSKLIDKYISNIESNRTDFASHDAIFFKTDVNSFDHNLIALKTLQTRLNEIQKMDQDKLAYSKAIEQITAQEQDNSKAFGMNHSIKGSYFLKNHKCSWKWIALLISLMESLTFAAWIIVAIDESY